MVQKRESLTPSFKVWLKKREQDVLGEGGTSLLEAIGSCGSIARAIGMGEAETLVLARSRNALAVLDDKEARAIAKSWNLEYTSTLMVLYEAFAKNLIGYDELVEDLAKLTKIMWISTDVITDIIRRAKEVKK
ncbi:hypothetical protein MUP05_02820 [Candidatus Bathyarchaeota archaeon]|nr:hypothetical protein [Candidatus Bathyarchaeota archaeon]